MWVIPAFTGGGVDKYFLTGLGKPQKKIRSFFSCPATKAIPPPPPYFF